MTNRKTTLFYAVLIAVASLAVGMVIASRLDLARSLTWLAGFGLLHGLMNAAFAMVQFSSIIEPGGEEPPNTACVDKWESPRFLSFFRGLEFFPFRRLVLSLPHATNANHWAVACSLRRFN